MDPALQSLNGGTRTAVLAAMSEAARVSAPESKFVDSKGREIPQEEVSGGD
jgi:hypothetical protein